ncbi:MAG TPA: amidase [Candidatus Limnocylindria bacterium]|nr:amidase [Candidatus Limnocylindria bacterium]
MTATRRAAKTERSESTPDPATRFASVVELAALLRKRKASAVELAESVLADLEREGPRYNALASLMRERALREARAADRALARGAARTPLVGIPYGAKDLLAAVGAPTTWGAPQYAEQTFDEDAAVVDRLRRAGAVLAAKLAMVELAGGGGYRYPKASLQGPGLNPWDTGRWSGGSSSGSGAAVGAGLVPFAIGSETSGSIGTPAAYCGVTGLRPTYGLVSRRGAMALSWTLDKIGPMARSAEDCAIVLEAIAGPDSGDATLSGKRFKRLDRRAATARVRAVRVGYSGEELVLATPEAKAALEKGIAEFRRILKPKVVKAALPEGLPYGPMVFTVHAAEGAAAFADLIESPHWEELRDTRQMIGLRDALDIRARDYLRALRLRTVLQERLRALFQDVDVLLSFGRNTTATPVGQRLDQPASGSGGAPASQPRPVGNVALIPAGNLAGLPAIFFPCGFGSDGLPVGLQLVGPPFSEPLLVALAEAYQRETDHHLRRPPAATATRRAATTP